MLKNTLLCILIFPLLLPMNLGAGGLSTFSADGNGNAEGVGIHIEMFGIPIVAEHLDEGEVFTEYFPFFKSRVLVQLLEIRTEELLFYYELESDLLGVDVSGYSELPFGVYHGSYSINTGESFPADWHLVRAGFSLDFLRGRYRGLSEFPDCEGFYQGMVTRRKPSTSEYVECFGYIEGIVTGFSLLSTDFTVIYDSVYGAGEYDIRGMPNGNYYFYYDYLY